MNVMKVKVIGIQRRHGISKKTQKAYDMCQIMVLRELKSETSAASTFIARGFTCDEMDAAVPLVEELKDSPFPMTAELQFDTMINDWGKPVSVVVGVKKV